MLCCSGALRQKDEIKPDETDEGPHSADVFLLIQETRFHLLIINSENITTEDGAFMLYSLVFVVFS